jgi:polysaccharide pyruvyl transferase WcaK-like protein
LTTVRDPLASKALTHVGVEHELMACPALHAARRVASGKTLSADRNNLLAINLMELAGHYQLKPQTDGNAWQKIIQELLPALRARYRLLFVAHDEAERKFMTQLRTADEVLFFSPDYRDYLEVYSRVGGMVANRVHGALCVAGFGRPAVIIGNDSRIGIARPIGIPAIDSADATMEWILKSLESQMSRRDEVRRRLLDLRESTARQYVKKIRKALKEHPATKDAFER